MSKGIVVDTETTGTNHDKDAIIELGMVLLHYFRYFVRVNVMKLEGILTAKKSVTSLKGLVKKPESQVTIAMMNEATTAHLIKKDQSKVDRKPSYKLADLLAEMDPNAPVPEDIKAWMEMKPVGKEIF